ncbi:hypothetical protein BDP27DRAFT_1368311 [Rhodocollybia butyracea]|uniref:Uncharacterized protein n=1 Tax=Rhodocollybia butyracea TaxID=206335 RepID=A0A9P5PH10_9AGAR|nr:hypothetical protein BDP27DRAFT_1368311 [Rhodocollybia butyracea]
MYHSVIQTFIDIGRHDTPLQMMRGKLEKEELKLEDERNGISGSARRCPLNYVHNNPILVTTIPDTFIETDNCLYLRKSFSSKQGHRSVEPAFWIHGSVIWQFPESIMNIIVMGNHLTADTPTGNKEDVDAPYSRHWIGHTQLSFPFKHDHQNWKKHVSRNVNTKAVLCPESFRPGHSGTCSSEDDSSTSSER